MRPHFAHIAKTLERKQAVDAALNQVSSYRKYKEKVDRALSHGYSKEQVFDEIELELKRIEADLVDGDELTQQGVRNAKISCINALLLVMSELKGDEQ